MGVITSLVINATTTTLLHGTFLVLERCNLVVKIGAFRSKNDKLGNDIESTGLLSSSQGLVGTDEKGAKRKK